MDSARPVLFLDHAPALGGAEHSLLLLLSLLDRARWSPHLACAGGPLAERASEWEVPTYPIIPSQRLRGAPLHTLGWSAGVRRIAQLATQVGAVILVANTVRTAFYGALAARLARIPFVWHMRDFWLTETQPRHVWADRLLKQALCASARGVIANSAATAQHLPCPRKVTVVHNGIDAARFDPTLNPAPFRRQHGIPLDAPVVGAVGRLRPWKGQDRFLRAMATLTHSQPMARFLVVGGAEFEVEDNYAEQLHRLAAELGMADRVTFTGQLSDTRPALAAMDVFVHPGDPEPFGLVNIEAMAMAKPVVAFAHGALPEIVADGKTGVLVAPGDEAALADAVEALLNSPGRRAALGQAGRTRLRQRFTADRMAAAVGAVLEEITR